MSRRLVVIGATLALLIGAFAPTAVARGPAGKAGIERLGISGIKPHLDLLAANRAKQITVIVTMAGKPLSLRIADAKAHGKSLTKAQQTAIIKELKALQAPTISGAKALGGTINETYQAAISGFSVRISAGKVAALRNLPGVTSVQLTQKFTLDNERSVPFIGAPSVWDASGGGYTGTGVKIADIDTGIDYYHANFGGSGNPADFAADNGLTAAPNFPTAKVIGGYDFVGDAYNADIPVPDDDPLDCNGHGSHTAGTMAGDGVLSTGATFTGPYNATTVSSHTWNIGPGVAPQASILAYRVFGCAGAAKDDVIIAAIDQAIVDGADVINMSLGAPFGTNDNADSVASNNASAAGVTVVASAGNSGPSGYIVGNPSTATSAISVAAMDGGYATFPGANLSNPAITAINANGATFTDGTTMPIKVLYTGTPHDAAHISLGCDPTEYTTAGVTGDLVVVKRGTCARVARAIYGQQAGAAAVLMVNNANSFPPYEGQITSNPDTGIPYTVTIPFLGVPSSNAAALVAADGQSTTLTNTTVANTSYKLVASFSSGGPRNGDSAMKPDIAAPGVSTVSTAIGTGTQGTALSGTSMAAPHVTGSAALVVQAHPTWTPEQIKAALMGTASISPSVLLSTNPRLVGAGLVQPRKAVDTKLYATTGANTSSLSFGEADLLAASTSSGTITFHNTGSSTVKVNLSSAFSGSSQGANLNYPNSVNVPAGGTATAMVQLKLSAAAVKNLLPAETNTFGTLVTIRGAITATPASAGTGLYALRIPFMVVPRGLSIVHPTSSSVDFGTASSAPLGLINDGKHEGNADFYALGQTSPDDGLGPVDLHATGVQTLPGAALGGAGTDRSLFFAINNYGKWNTPSQLEFDVFIDTNNDGNPDFDVVGFDFGALTTGSFDGRYASFIFTYPGFSLVDAWVADAPMNSSSLLLPTLASEIGVTSGSSSFRYAVGSFNLWTGDGDGTDWANFDAFTPPVSTGDYIGLTGGHSATDTLTIDRTSLTTNPVDGWLIQTMDDAADSGQADVVNLTYTP